MAAQSLGIADGLGTIVNQVADEKGIDRQVLIETMEAAGLVGPLQSNGSREVLAPPPPEE